MNATDPDRTRRADRPAVGPPGPPARVAAGTEDYEALRHASANETPTMPPRDPDPRAARREADERPLPAPPAAGQPRPRGVTAP